MMINVLAVDYLTDKRSNIDIDNLTTPFFPLFESLTIIYSSKKYNRICKSPKINKDNNKK